MSKYGKIVASLGIAVGLGVAALPIAGASAIAPVTDDAEINVNISEVLSLTLDADSVTAPTIAPGNSTSATTTAKVVTNSATGYTLHVSASNSNLVHSSGTDDPTYRIAYKTASEGISNGGWHISYTTNVSGYASGDVDSLAAGSGLIMQSNTTTGNNGATATVTYNIKALGNQASGNYTGAVTYTAAAKPTS